MADPATIDKKKPDLPAQLEQEHGLLDSALHDGSKADIARFSMQIVNTRRALGHDVSVDDARIQQQALEQLVGVMNEKGKPRRGTLIIDDSGAFNAAWKERAVEITRELFEGGANVDALRISVATRLVTENPHFAQAVMQQAALDAEQAAAPAEGAAR